MAGNTAGTNLNPTPVVSVIIPHYNGVEILRECLNFLLESSLQNKEIIVVDNGSSDESCEMVEAQFPAVKLIESSENRGYAGGCNLGAEQAESTQLVFLNNDTIPDVGWLEPLVKRINSDENISSVQPKILDAKKKDHFEYAGGSGGYMDRYGFPFARGRIFDTVEKDEGQYDNACHIFWASGTAFITRKEVFLQMGGFDEKFFAHFEEIDYHWKCHLAGYSVWVEPASVVYHKGGGTLKYDSPRKTYLNHRNSFVMVASNTSGKELFIVLLIRILFEKISILRDLLRGRFGHAWAHVKAGFWIILNLGYLCKRRKKIKEIRKISSAENLYRGSIVTDYFLKGKKTFSQFRL